MTWTTELLNHSLESRNTKAWALAEGWNEALENELCIKGYDVLMSAIYRYRDGMTIKEIAKELGSGMTVEKVRTRLLYAEKVALHIHITYHKKG